MPLLPIRPDTVSQNLMTIGVVIIGRNEGARLVTCLASAVGEDRLVVYVDSGSTDDSVAHAKAAGADVVMLDMSQPFTAARARNAGFALLQERHQAMEFVQFVDGDCEIVPGWFAAAEKFLRAHADCAAVCGRRRERRPDANKFHRLTDKEWATPIGEAEACGGDVLIRVSAFEAVEGYNPALIAGEEPEMCLRMREAGWTIHRIDEEMTLHDINITRFSQWWTRARRAGHAFAEVSHKHRHSEKRIWQAETRRALMWASFLPAFLIAAVFIHPAFIAGLLIYPLQAVRLSGREGSVSDACLLILAKFPEAIGVLQYWRGQIFGGRSRLIEYKSS